MGWLNYADDEVTVFHPSFLEAANEALKMVGLDGQFEWEHHPKRRHGEILPDFVLKNKPAGKWVLVVEIKRRRDSVYSSRNQYQAKSYAEDNESLYFVGRPRYFCLTNLEVSILFALNGTRPPLECQLKNGVFVSGTFRHDSAPTHKANFVRDLIEICRTVTSVKDVEYERVWPSVLENLVAHTRAVPASRNLLLDVPSTPNWELVESYFGIPSEQNAARLFLLRCFMAEYLRGALKRWGHPRANSVPGLRSSPTPRIAASVANTLDKLQAIDFLGVFEDAAPRLYRTLKDPALLRSLESYVRELVDEHVPRLAAERVDALELLDSLFSSFNPLERLPQDGKVQTDPDLASLLASLTISEQPKTVYDVGCGTGSLMAAAYDRLLDLGVDERTALRLVTGLDADDVSSRIAGLRIAMRSPRLLTPQLNVRVALGDIFCQEPLLRSADVVLMNPPFRRYESQDEKPVPKELREHYAEAIRRLDGKGAETVDGQVNLYNYYVEYVVKGAAEGTRFGLILDNKWYHSRYGQSLRRFLLRECEILAVVDYPHSLYFKSFTIATSLLILRKAKHPSLDHSVRFVRCKTDPQQANATRIASAMHEHGSWPADWSVREIPQKDLDYKVGWKRYLMEDFENDFLSGLTPLSNLFAFSRRGSLEKEGGGTGVIDFPFNRTDYGPSRLPASGKGEGWKTSVGRKLIPAENTLIVESAKRIPEEFRGWAVQNADELGSYVLRKKDVKKTETLEPPNLRGLQMFYRNRRTKWTPEHDKSLEEMKTNPDVSPFVENLAHIVGLDERVLSRDKLWVALREPYAGELIIPRKMRAGHRVHVNPFAFLPNGRQLKISSNFVAYSNCTATDPGTALDRETATMLIAAFLVSSFGQVQFEREGYNREGVLAIEENQLDAVRVLDPRQVSLENRKNIIQAFQDLPYPIRADVLSQGQEERNELDQMIAKEIERITRVSSSALLTEVHDMLDEWLDARQP